MADYDENLDSELTETELSQLVSAFQNSEEPEEEAELEDLDNLLARLMDAEKQLDELETANEGNAIEEISAEAIEEINESELFEDSPKRKPIIELGKIRQLYDSGVQHSKIMTLAIISIAGLILLGGLGLGALWLFSPSSEVIDYDDGPDWLEIEDGNIVIPVAGVTQQNVVRISRMYLNTSASVFHITLGEFFREFSNLEFYLYDNLSNSYQQIMPSRLTRANVAIVSFEPLNLAANNFTLYIRNAQTDDETSFSYSFNPSHISTPLQIANLRADYNITLNAEFANSHSVIHLVADDDGESVVFSENTEISLRNAGVFITSLSEIEFSSVDGLQVASAYFNSLRSFASPAYIRVSNIYVQRQPDILQNSAHMFVAGDDRQTVFELDGFQLTIHGLERRGQIFIMPLFGEMITESGSERIPTNPEVYLMGINENGQEIAIRGEVLYDHRGTDVRFSIQENPAILDINQEDLNIIIPNIHFGLNHMDIRINLQ